MHEWPFFRATSCAVSDTGRPSYASYITERSGADVLEAQRCGEVTPFHIPRSRECSRDQFLWACMVARDDVPAFRSAGRGG